MIIGTTFERALKRRNEWILNERMRQIEVMVG
jgi:hypothetical protein